MSGDPSAGAKAIDGRVRVLVVEDSATDAEIVIRELKRAGFDPDWTRVDCESAFIQALQTEPDIILSDYNLPQFDGMRAVEILRERGSDIPFILISGALGEELAATAIKRGADDYLLKDRLQRLGSAVSNAIQARRLRHEQAAAEAARRESDARYRLLAENTADVIWTLDIASMRITYVSPSAERLTGRPPDDVLAGRFEDSLTPESLATVRAKLRTTLEAYAKGEGESVRVQRTEVDFIRTDGTVVPAEMVTTILVEDGRPTTVLGVSRDIRERRRSEAEARRNTERLRALYELGQRQYTTEAELIEDALRENLSTSASSEIFFHTLADDHSILALRWLHDDDISPAQRNARGLLWSDCIRSRRPIARSNPLTADGAGRTGPTGHVEYAIAVPVLDGTRLTAVAGLVRLDEPFDDTGVLQLQLFTDRLWRLVVRRRGEEALAASEERYRRIVETTNEGICLVDCANRFTWVNQRMADLLQVSPAEIIGQNCDDFIDGAAPGFGAFALAPHRGGTREVRLRRKSGAVVTAVVATTPLFNERGHLEGALAIVTDVSALRQSDEQRQLLATAIDQAAESVIITDTRGQIRYVNPAFTSITGYTFDEACGMNPRMLKSGRHPSEFYEDVWSTLLRGGVWSGRFINRRKDGSEYEEDTTISPVRDADGATIAYVAVKRDVSEVAALEAQLRHSQKMEAIGTLAGGVAHDFNNLLQALISQVQVLRKRINSPEKIAEVIAQLETQVKRGASLTRQLLLFARRETGRRERFDLGSAVRGTLDMLRHLVRENVYFEVELTSDELPVQGDRGEIEQILTNLVVNASDAMPDGGTLTVGARRGADGVACLIVQDTGAGISAAVRERIFEPFFTTKTGEHGTGLGLSVVHGIVTKYGGRIDVVTGSGGTTFTVRIPLAADRRRSAIDPVPPSPAPGGAHERILLVEDEDAAREGLVQMLDILGYAVTGARTAEEALSIARDSRFDVLLTDMTLPGMPGKDLAHDLLERWPDLHVILMSGYNQDRTVRLAAGGQQVKFLQKPFEVDELAIMLRAVLSC